METHEVIVVTDGDPIACEAVKVAAADLGLHVIAASGGHPTKLTGQEIAKLVTTADTSPVVVMLDDRGDQLRGNGETALVELIRCEQITVIGAVAVASGTKLVQGVHVDVSVNKDGQMVREPVDKNGRVITKKNALLRGDTVDVLDTLDIPIIVGLGDPGKQHHHDDVRLGAPLTKMALNEILKRSHR